jgi:hypothetical protein
VLLHVYPEADVPVVQLSINRTQTGRWQYPLEKKLRPLRDEIPFPVEGFDGGSMSTGNSGRRCSRCDQRTVITGRRRVCAVASSRMLRRTRDMYDLGKIRIYLGKSQL